MTPSQTYALDKLKAGPIPFGAINGKVRDALVAKGLIRCRAVIGKSTPVLELTGKAPPVEEARKVVPRQRAAWTDERVDLAKSLWKDGKSGSEIAATLGPDFTRNSVIGKLHRVGVMGDRRAVSKPASLSKKAAPPPVKRERAGGIATDIQPAMAKKPTPSRQSQLVTDDERRSAFKDRPGSLSWDDIRAGDHRCRWPYDADDGSTRYCAETVTETATSYCSFHNAVAAGHGTPSERIAHQPSGAAS